MFAGRWNWWERETANPGSDHLSHENVTLHCLLAFRIETNRGVSHREDESTWPKSRLHGQVMVGSMLTSGAPGYSLSQQSTSCPANGYVAKYPKHEPDLADSRSCRERMGFVWLDGSVALGLTQEFTQN